MPSPVRAVADRGAVTVEAAIGLSALTLVFGMVLAGVAAVAGQFGCLDAAREAARLLARGEQWPVQEVVTELAPRGARLAVRRDETGVTVDVSAEPIGGLLPGIHLHGQAHAKFEPGEDGDADARE